MSTHRMISTAAFGLAIIMFFFTWENVYGYSGFAWINADTLFLIPFLAGLVGAAASIIKDKRGVWVAAVCGGIGFVALLICCPRMLTLNGFYCGVWFLHGVFYMVVLLYAVAAGINIYYSSAKQQRPEG